MLLPIEIDRSGVAVLVINELDRDGVDTFVDQISSLVQDRADVSRVTVEFVGGGEPPPLLQYLVSALDRQARNVGKTVDLATRT